MGDALARYYDSSSGHRTGLRDGTFDIQATNTGYNLWLNHMQWTADLTVCSLLQWNKLTGAIRVLVTFTAAGHSGSVGMAWNDRQTEAVATLTGTVDGAALDAERIAP